MAINQGLDVGDVYQSGDEWGFNVVSGENSYSAFEKEFYNPSAGLGLKMISESRMDVQQTDDMSGWIGSASSFTSSMATGFSDYMVSGNKYRGKSGNYYSYQGRKGWNQYTGTKAHMNQTLSNARLATRATYGLGALNYGLLIDQKQSGDLNEVAFSIEMVSNTIGTFAPPIVSIPWTLGYEGLGRNLVARNPWYQNKFKPWMRKKVGISE